MRKHLCFAMSASMIIALCASTGLVLAQAKHPRAASAAPQAPLAPTVTNRGSCAAGSDTQNSDFTPADDTTNDNPAAAGANLLKTCDGLTIGTFSAEVSTVTANSFIHLDMVATCIAAAGQPSPCTPGQTVFALPGHTFFRTTSGANGAWQVHSMTMVWPALPKGKWAFRVKPGGDGTATLGYRTFTVVTY
jgi:hypothetical protein